MNYCRPFAVVAMIALMMCSVVQAQDEAAPARGGRGQGQQGRGAQQDPAAQAQMIRFTLLRIEEVQAALGLEDEAVETLNAALQDAMPARGGRGGAGGAGGRPGQGGGAGGAGGTGGTGGGRTETGDNSEAQAKRAAAIETINKTLSEDQHARLTGIVAQAMQGRAVTDKIIAEKLEITEEQTAEIAKVIEKSSADMRSTMQDLMADGGQPDRAAMQEAMADINKELNEAMMEVLTDGQKKALEELKGEAVELPEAATRAMMMGGGRGFGGGGRGGQGGGGGGRPGASGLGGGGGGF